MLLDWRKSTVINRVVTLVLMASVIGSPMGALHLARAGEQQELTQVTRLVTCLHDSEHRDAEMPADGQTTLAEHCPVNAASIPVVRTLPVLIAPDLEPVGHSRRIVKKGLAPEVLEFLRVMHRKIADAQEYPPNAIKLGLQGTATVQFILMPDGNAQALRIRKTSGHGMLDEAAVETIQRVLPLKPPPEAGDRPMELNIPISFALR